jgi:hypothetical protein
MGQRSITMFSSAARTSHTNSAEINTQSAKNITVDIDVTAFTGTSITYTLQGYDVAKSGWYTLVATAAITTTGHSILTVGPEVTIVANVAAQRVVPLRVRLVPSGTITSVTYSASILLSSD